jgi:transcriptional regulator
MYNLPYFKENDPEVVLSFMHKHPFILLTGADKNGRPVATHVPVLIRCQDKRIFLRGHMMKGTAHHKAFQVNPQALAIFNGPHTYVSASWYSDPLQGSTWNYMTVHAHGNLRFLLQEELFAVLEQTTALFENNPNSPSLYTKLPGEYIQKLVKAIVAFELEVTDIDNVFKLSQNRDEESFHKIIAKLDAGDAGSKMIAAEMRLRASDLYGGTRSNGVEV